MRTERQHEKAQDMNIGLIESASGAGVFLGSIALEATVHGAMIAGLIAGTVLVVDGLRRN